MSKLNKHLYTTICSIFLLGLTSCTNSSNKVTNNDKSVENKIYSKTRTISKDDAIKIIDNDKYSYEYNYGVSSYSPVGVIPEDKETNSNLTTENNNNSNEQLFTLEDVERLTNELTNEYNSYIQANSKEYENYINQLNKNYNSLENEYNLLLNDISNLNNSLNDETVETNSKDEKTEETIIPKTREEEVDLIYQKAIDTASKNLDVFEPIQGQNPKNEINNNTNTDNKNQSNEIFKLSAENIYKEIKNNIVLPNHETKDASFLINNYNIPSDKILDFKLLSNISSNNQQNPFEMLIIKTSDLNENDLTNKITSRINSILNNISENNININDKILLVDLNDYLIFCISNINKDILSFLQSL